MSERTSEPHAVVDGDMHSFLTKAIKELRDKLIDISKRNPLIAFKHSERGASYLRVIDERPDALFQRLQNGQMRFEPLPDPQAEPADEKTPDFRMALEEARLTDAKYLAAMETLGEFEHDEEKAAEAEKTLRAHVRKLLGLPPLAAGGRLNIDDYARAHGIDPSFDLSSRADDPSPHLTDDLIRVLYVKERLARFMHRGAVAFSDARFCLVFGLCRRMPGLAAGGRGWCVIGLGGWRDRVDGGRTAPVFK